MVKERIILGLMTYGPDASMGARITSVEETRKHFEYLASKGYTELDTARVYVDRKQEAFTAQVGFQDLGFSIATKLYPITPGDHKPENIRKQIDISREALGVETLDTWYLHAADRSVPFEETLEEVNKLHKEGKFRQLAISNYTAFELAEVVTLCRERGWVQPTLYQAMYNAITRGIDKELVVACRRYGLDIVIYNPLAGGFFSGKYKPDDLPSSGRFSDANNTGPNYRARYFRNTYFDALKLIEPVVKAHNLTLIETALRWTIHHSALKTRAKGGNDGVIIGVSSFEQLENNIADLEKGPLPEEVVRVLDEAWHIVKADGPNYWHGELEYGYELERPNVYLE